MFSRALLRGIALYRLPRAQHIGALGLRLQANRVVASRPIAPLFVSSTRFYSSGSSADDIIEEIEGQYLTAKDEFEIAYEETEKMSVYAEDDRKAAREELDKLEAAYKDAVENADPEVGQEVRKRVGRGIRELANAVKNMEEMAQNQD